MEDNQQPPLVQETVLGAEVTNTTNSSDENQNEVSGVTESSEPATEQKNTEFKLTVKQVDEEGQAILDYGIKFSLKPELSNKIDFIIGTSLNELFTKMELAKAMNTKLFKSKYPLMISVASEQHHLDFGKVDQVFLNKMKLNNGERSKLQFIDRIIVMASAMLKPIDSIRASELRAKQVELVQEAFPDSKKPKGVASLRSLHTIAESILVVDNEGEIKETTVADEVTERMEQTTDETIVATDAETIVDTVVEPTEEVTEVTDNQDVAEPTVD